MNLKSAFLNELKERGLINQYTNLEGLDALLYNAEKKGEAIVGYGGFDASASSQAIGNLVLITMLRWFQKFGHKPIVLIGGATTRIGDPSFKDKERPLLSEKEVQTNISGAKKSLQKFLKFGKGKTDAILIDNYDWFKNIKYMDFLKEIGKIYSVNNMLAKESVKKRLASEQFFSFLEFNYMLLQGYDFVHLNKEYNCMLQLSGADQWGNLTVGVELIHKLLNKEVYGITAPLITDSTGRKIGKSEGNAVWLNEDMTSPYDYYQYWRNIPDSEVGKLLRIFTDLPINEIKKLEALKDAEINDAKKILAFEATKICHGETSAKKAEQTAIETFEKGGTGAALPTIIKDLSKPIGILDLFTEAGLASSKKEARRLIDQGGAYINNEQIKDENLQIDKSYLKSGEILLSAGKKKKAVIKGK